MSNHTYFLLPHVVFPNSKMIQRSTMREKTNTQFSRDWNSTKISLLTLLSVTIILSNSLVAFLFFWKKPIRKKVTNILLFNKACVDILNGLLFAPVTILIIVCDVSSNEFVFGTFYCFSLITSLFSITLLAFERYFSVSRPYIHRQVVTKGRVTRAIILIWILSTAVVMLAQAWYLTSTAVKKRLLSYYTYVLWGIVAVTCSVVVCLYGGTVGRTRKFIKSQRGRCLEKHLLEIHKKEMRVTKLFIALFVAFLLTYLPALIINIFDFSGMHDERTYELISDAILLIYLSNSVFNPTLTICIKVDFLLAFKSFLAEIQRKKNNKKTKSCEMFEINKKYKIHNIQRDIMHGPSHSPKESMFLCHA